MKKKVIFTGIGEPLINVIKHFLLKKDVEISAIIPLYKTRFSNNFIKKLKKNNLLTKKILNYHNINSKKCLSRIKKISPDLICNWGYNKLFSEKILKVPRKGCLNIHPGLLPFGRGSGAVQGEIINGEKTIGWSCHLMDKKFDNGYLISQKKIKFNKNSTPYLNEIIDKLLYGADKFYINTIEKILMSKKIKKKKIKNFGRYYPKFAEGDEYIDWNNESELIIRKIRSRSPQRLSVTYLKRQKREFYIKKASHSKIKNYNFVNGQVIDKDKKKASWLKQLIMQYG